MPKPIVASYCTTFLKPEMLHIYRQITSLKKFETFIVTKTRQQEDRFPFPHIEKVPDVKSNFLRRFWLKYVKKEPPIVYRGEYGVLHTVLERRQADLMHIYFGHTGVHLLPFIKRWPMPVTVSFHGIDVQPRKEKPGYLENLRELLQIVPLVMARSESLKNKLGELGCPLAKIRINRTGIPLQKFPYKERKRPQNNAWKFVQACRLIEKKGIDVSLKAFARFVQKYPQATFTLAGEGPLKEKLQQLATDLGIAERVFFKGFLNEEDLCQLYHQSHLFLHPSQLTADQNQEGIPNSMLEAMATGLPVLATMHGGIPEAVVHEKTGLLVPERDSGALFAQMQIITAIQGPWEAMMQAAAKEMHTHFEAEKQIEKLESFYSELI